MVPPTTAGLGGVEVKVVLWAPTSAQESPELCRRWAIFGIRGVVGVAGRGGVLTQARPRRT